MLSNEQKREYVKSKYPKAILWLGISGNYYISNKGNLITGGYAKPEDA